MTVDTDTLRATLTDALRLNVNPPIWPRGWERQLDALLPVVESYARERAAEELLGAAEEMPMNPKPWEASQILRARSADLVSKGAEVALRGARADHR